MGLRICLVTPFAWSQPHDVNEHVAGVAEELRALGHSVTILASSNRAKELAAGRRALLDGVDADVVALGPAVPISRRSRIGVPVGARTNLSLALELGRLGADDGDLPLGRAPVVSPGPCATGSSTRPPRCARSDQRGDGRGRSGAL